jgi:hypothetical protein
MKISSRPNENMEEAYNIKKNEKGHIGYAVIINNYSFKNQRTGKPEPRQGSKEDVENLKKSFKRLHFEIHEPVLQDLTSREMRFKLEQLVETGVDFSQYSCLICVVMSHGGESGKIYGLDWRYICLDQDIISIFSECEQLHGKPKLFFVQTCRGGLFAPKVVKVDDEQDNKMNMFDFAGREDSSGNRDSEKTDCNMQSVLKLGDIIVHYATVEHYVSFRNVIAGSCFIRSLCFVLDNYAANEPIEIDRLLRMVNSIVMNTYKRQQPEYKNTLNKLCFLNIDKTWPREAALEEDKWVAINIIIEQISLYQ